MNTSWTLDLVWWITVVELPALASLFWMIWRTRKEHSEDLGSLREQMDHGLSSSREALSAYKLEVAKNYASITYMKDVERRLTGHLVRIENKLDVTTRQATGGPSL